jgi:hypothetical protein
MRGLRERQWYQNRSETTAGCRDDIRDRKEICLARNSTGPLRNSTPTTLYSSRLASQPMKKASTRRLQARPKSSSGL